MSDKERTTGLDFAELAVLEILITSREPKRFKEVIEELSGEWREDIVRQAIWSLLDLKKIRITVDRRLEHVGNWGHS